MKKNENNKGNFNRYAMFILAMGCFLFRNNMPLFFLTAFASVVFAVKNVELAEKIEKKGKVDQEFLVYDATTSNPLLLNTEKLKKS